LWRSFKLPFRLPQYSKDAVILLLFSDFFTNRPARPIRQLDAAGSFVTLLRIIFTFRPCRIFIIDLRASIAKLTMRVRHLQFIKYVQSRLTQIYDKFRQRGDVTGR
jgi:hypothetical protein